MKKTPLSEAKQKFIESAGAIDPLRPLRDRPLFFLCSAALLGAAAGYSKRTAKNLSELLSLALLLSRKILSLSLEASEKQDQRQDDIKNNC